ncbi:MAG: UDP-3-O-(3-hydroxymyristoyl)glucosamine N-acyltransferase [Geminicoccaceae bacterium]
MADTRFFRRSGPFSAGELAAAAGCGQITGDGGRSLFDVATLADATGADVAFLGAARYRDDAAATRAGMLVLSPELVDAAPAACTLLVVDDPQLAFARIARTFYRQDEPAEAEFEADSRYGHALVDRRASLAESVRVGPGAVVQAGSRIGGDVTVGALAVIGPGVVIGAGSRIGSGVKISHALLGEEVVVQAGAVIGEAGFGFAMGTFPYEDIPQLGRVLVGRGARLGANVTIHRGSLGDTVIGDHCRIDNLVMVAHNVRVGDGAVIVAQTGISGSSGVGARSVLGGQSGVSGHLRIGDGVRIAARSGVTRDIPDGSVYGGFPAQPVTRWRREVATLRRLARQGRNNEGEEADE